MFGWTGKLVRIDLNSCQIREERIPVKILHRFLGGKGLGTYFLFKEVRPRADPLGSENKFYLAAGPLQGTRIPITGRCTAVSKSPLTGLYIDSGIGGYLGPELKRAGYDLLVIQGEAENPVWVQISENDLDIHNASDLWGKTTHETELELRKKDPKIRVLSTGPAGEKRVRFACLTHNYFRNLGRGGLGAVFGAKNLKAIAIRGPRVGIPIPDSDKERELVIQLGQRAKKAKKRGHSLHFYGTSWLVDYANKIGMFPTRNFQSAYFEPHSKISDEALESLFAKQKRRTPCEGCVISCAWTLRDQKYSWAPIERTGKIALPEYETLGLMGGDLGIDDLMAVVQANHICNEMGLDTISTGNVIGFFMELTQRNLLPEDMKKAGISFGDAQGLLKLIPSIANRKGIGDQLAKGVRQLAQEVGRDAELFAIQTKGLEYPAWDPRGKLALGLSYVTAAAGASHLRGWASTTKPPESSALPLLDSLIEQQNLKILKDSLVICHFTHSISPRLTLEDCVTLFGTTTGISATLDSVQEIAHRIWMLARMFNIREYDHPPRHYDVLPHRLMNEPIPDGPTKGYTAFISQKDFEASLTEFYAKRGCDSKGHPTTSALQDLGLATLRNS